MVYLISIEESIIMSIVSTRIDDVTKKKQK